MADVRDEVRVEEAPAVALPGPPAVRSRRRQRRPTGAPPPLPRKIGLSGAVWLALIGWLIVSSIIVSRSSNFSRIGDHVDTWWLQLLARARVGWLVAAANGLKVALSSWGVTVLGLGTVVLLLVFRRWRHLLVFLIATFALEIAGVAYYDAITRPRPYGVTIVAGWGGFSMPSAPVGFLAAILIGIIYTMVVPGRPRWYAKLAAGAVVVVFGLARMYLGIEHPSDVVYGIIMGVAIPVTAFRLFTPNEVFPVTYRKGKAAHLDVSGRRAEAIRQAVLEQLGLTVVEIKPVGLEGSGGSTPLRLRVEGEPDTYLFAKLYAKSHVRADRWYKLGRRILYGALEDESPFQTVRRLAEYEDYTLRLLWDNEIPTARPYGIVEITPEQEYMLVTEFFKGAVEISEAEVDDAVIDDALLLIRRMWDVGVAHRDIKPANLMVRDGKVLLIDVFFVQVRPSPWRQAVDLGNMMLVLAVHTDARRVYDRALRLFTPDELAEAFAATRGVASPTQLRAFVKRDGRDLLSEFRALAPERPRIALQRWSLRRLGLALGTLAVVAVALAGGTPVFFPAQDLGARAPECGTGHTAILTAQSVPSAALVPCVASLPSGWSLGTADIRRGETRFFLEHDRAGRRAVDLVFAATCDTGGSQEIPSDEPGTRRFERPETLQPGFTGVRYYRFAGGCVTYRMSLGSGSTAALLFDVDAALTFEPRSALESYVRRTEDLALCGRGAPCRP